VSLLSTPVAVTLAVVLAGLVIGIILRLWRFEVLVALLMFSLTNFAMVSNKIAVKLPDGDSLFEIRDVLIIIVIAVGIIKGQKYLVAAARHPLIWPGLVIVALLPFAAALGFINNGDPLLIAREMFSSSGWLIAWVVAANVRDPKTLRTLTTFMILMGLLVAVGASIEIFSGASIAIVSAAGRGTIFGPLVRTTPDGWLFMTIAQLFVAVAWLTSGKWGRFGSSALAVIFLVLGISMLLTQIRIMLLTFLMALFFFSILCMVSNPKLIGLRKAALVLFLVMVILVAAVQLLKYLAEEPFWVEVATERYLTFYRDVGGRVYELTHAVKAWEGSPFTGIGLGVRYRDDLPFFVTDTGTGVHNILGFYLLKLGLLGLVLFLVFCIQVIRTLLRFVHYRQLSETNVAGLGLSTALVGVLIVAQSGNVFGAIQGLPIAAIAIGLLVSYERLASQAANVQRKVNLAAPPKPDYVRETG
jgi:hypothetical protein